MNLFPLLVPAGSDGQIQYNDGNLFGGDSALTWDDGATKALTIGNCAVLGSDSAVFQPNADSTTFFQVLDVDGGAPVLNVDTTDEIVTFANSIDFFNDPANRSTIQAVSGNLVINANLDAGSDVIIGFDHNNSGGMDDLLFYKNQTLLSRQNNDGSFIFDVPNNTLAGDGSGNVGFGESAPETHSEWTSTAPYLTLHNSTHEDSDGGRESRLNFKGEQSGGEETTLARQEVGHDGAADDEKGYWDLFINDGSDGDSPTKVVRVDSSSASMKVKDKVALTSIGGIAVRLTNTTGAATVQGQTVKSDTATDDAVILTAADDDECIGVFLEAGIADDAEAWVVVAGIADVAMGDNEAATHGNWVETNSAEAGYADATSASPVAAPQHFNEIGHCIESVAAGGGGTHILARCVLHFN